MATIVFGNGKKVNFNGTPTQKDIDEVATKLGFNSTGNTPTPVPEKSLEDRVIEYPSQSNSDSLPTMVGNLINPMPFAPTMSNPIPNIPAEFEKKRQLAEQAGLKARDTLLGQTGDVVSNVSEKAHRYLPKTLATAVSTLMGIGGGVVGTELSLAPMTPGENALTRAPGMMANAISRGTRGWQAAIANRNLQAKPSIQQSRYESGQPSVGEVALDNPKDVADLATNNKDTIYKKSRLAIGVLGDKIKNKINEVFTSGKSQTGAIPPFNQPGDVPSIKTAEIANSINPIMVKVAENEGENSNTYQALVRLKELFLRKGDSLNFATANAERVRLGSEIGKSFQKETSALPEVIEAQRNMWGALRNKIGMASPELDEMLKLQHDLIDVNHSALPTAAKGYTSTPGGAVEAVKTPFRRMEIADFLANRLPNDVAQAGTVAGTGSYSVTDALKNRGLSDFIDKVKNRKKQ